MHRPACTISGSSARRSPPSCPRTGAPRRPSRAPTPALGLRRPKPTIPQKRRPSGRSTASSRAEGAVCRPSGARLLGLLGRGPHARQLAAYLDDPEPSVRILAVKSAAIALDPMLPPKLVPRLNDRAIRRAVREALAAYGDDAVRLLAETLDDRRLPAHLRVHVPRILRQIGTERAAAAMLFSNVQDDAFLRYVIVEELSRLRRSDPKLKFDEGRAEEAALRRLRAYTHYRPIAKDLAWAKLPFALLRRAINDRVLQNLEAALRILGLIYDTDAMEHALRGFLKDDPTARADALELIDVSLQGSQMRAQVLQTLEVGSETSPPGGHLDAAEHERRVLDRAFALVETRDMQLAMIAWETLRRCGHDPPDVREPSLGEPLMPKSILDRLFLLEGVQLFHGLSVDDLAAVAALTTEGHADPGAIIYREGDAGDSMSVITSGEVHLLRASQALMDLGVGDSFGETSILDKGPRPVTARAGDSGVDFLILERAPFMDLIADRPPIVNGLFMVIGRRLRQLLELTGTSPSEIRSPGNASSTEGP
jgi:CRP-like cAMP-binding protein